MKRELTVTEIFKNDAIEIINKRNECLLLHSKNIRAAGDQVEIYIREYFRKRIPKRYYVTQGHLIDDVCNTSPQLDLIISDSSNLPSLFTSQDGTEFIPIDSTYIIGEIKSSYIKSEKYIQKFSKTLKKIGNDLNHIEKINTAFNGISLTSDLRDLILGRKHRILNSIFSFMIFVDSGDFNFNDIGSFLLTTDAKYLPNIIILLNKGIIQKGKFSDEGPIFTDLPREPAFGDYEWCFIPIYGENEDSICGNNLLILYFSLIRHLSMSFLEPPSFEGFIQDKIKFDLSKIERIKQ